MAHNNFASIECESITDSSLWPVHFATYRGLSIRWQPWRMRNVAAFHCEMVKNFPNQSRRTQWLPNEQAPHTLLQISIGIWPMTTSIVLKSVRGSRLEHFRAKVSGLAARSSKLDAPCSSQVPPRLLHGCCYFCRFCHCHCWQQ